MSRSAVSMSYKGYKTVAALLKGAVKDRSIPKNPRDIKYVKQGDLFQALMDFSSVSPKNVRSFRQSNKMYGQVGYAGDTTIIIRQEKSGEPIIKFFKTTEANNPKSKRTIITYKATPRPPKRDNPYLGDFIDLDNIRL